MTVEDLPTFQSPAYGTPAHTRIMNQRNAVESPFGTARAKGGLEPGSCKAARLEPHALAALMVFVVMNLQTTMNQEIKEVQDLLKRHRQSVHPDGAEPVDAVDPVDDEQVDGAEPVDAVDDERSADMAEPVDDERSADVQPDDDAKAATSMPDDNGGSTAAVHKRPRPPP